MFVSSKVFVDFYTDMLHMFISFLFYSPRFFRTKFSAPLVSPTVNAIVNVFSIKTAIALTVSEFPVFNPKSNPDPINLLQTNNVMEMATPSNA